MKELYSLFSTLQQNPSIASTFYEDIFNNTFSSNVENLQKAITAGMEGTRWAPIFENLDPVFTSTTVNDKTLALLPKIAKLPAESITYEYNRLTALTNQANEYIFSAESGNPQADDSVFSRHTSPMVVLGTKREVSVVTTKTKTALAGMSPVQAESQFGATYVSTALEKSLFYGMRNDDDGVECDTYAFDGILRQSLEYARSNTSYYADNIIDLDGGSLGLDTLENSSRILRDNYLSDFSNIYAFMPNFALADFSILNQPHGRMNLVNAPKRGQWGSPAVSYQSQFGNMWLNSTVLIDSTKRPPLPSATANAPTTPATLDLSLTTPTRSWWDAPTTVYYRVSAFTHGEESVTLAAASAASVGADGAVTLTVTPGATRGAAIRIYKSYDNVKWYHATDMKTPTAGTVVYEDNNLHSGRPWGFVVNLGAGPEPGTNDLELRQLAPFFRFPLAQVQLTIPWLHCMFAGLVVRAPNRVVLLKDIAPLS